MDFTPLADSENDQLTCNIADIPTDGSNLVIKVSGASLAFQKILECWHALSSFFV